MTKLTTSGFAAGHWRCGSSVRTPVPFSSDRLGSWCDTAFGRWCQRLGSGMAAIAKVWDGVGHGRDQKAQQASRKLEHFSKAQSTCSTRCAVFRKSRVAASRPESARDKTCPVGLAAVNSNHLRLCARSSLATEELREHGVHNIVAGLRARQGP